MHWLKWTRLIGIVLLIWILWTIDWKRILPTLASLHPGYLFAYVFCFACMAGVRVLRLHLCTRRLGFSLHPSESYAATVEPMFMGVVTPGRIGELSRIAHLSQYGMPSSLAIVLTILERIIDLCTLLGIAIGGVVYLFGSSGMRPYAFSLIGLLLALLYLSFPASSLFTGVFERLTTNFFRALSLPFADAQGKLWKTVPETVRKTGPLIEALSIVGAALNLCQIYMLSLAFGFGGSRIAICFAYTVSAILSLLPISPGGLGTREATYIYVMGRQGIAREQALLFSLLEGVVLGTLGPAVMAAPLWVRSGIRRLVPPRTPANSDVSVNPLVLVFRSIRKRGLSSTAEYIWSEVSFDWRFHSETRAPVAVNDLAVNAASKDHAAPYQGASWLVLRRVFGSLIGSGRIDPASTCLVDFGCGKGRVLLAALHFEIAKTIGVEFDPQLCETARNNLLRYRRRRGTGRPLLSWEVIHSDVLDFTIPSEANLFFLYNPFSGPVLKAVAERIRQACQDPSRRRYVVYVNPVHEEVFRKLGFERTPASDDEVAIYTMGTQREATSIP